ncbi:MAG: hypothetical protein R2697_03930 [Ilumatobacteraceae bacterium]
MGATEEAAGGAAVLVDPTDVDSIAGGVVEAMSRRDVLVDAGRSRVSSASWAASAAATAAAYREVAR